MNGSSRVYWFISGGRINWLFSNGFGRLSGRLHRGGCRRPCHHLRCRWTLSHRRGQCWFTRGSRRYFHDRARRFLRRRYCTRARDPRRTFCARISLRWVLHGLKGRQPNRFRGRFDARHYWLFSYEFCRFFYNGWLRANTLCSVRGDCLLNRGDRKKEIMELFYRKTLSQWVNIVWNSKITQNNPKIRYLNRSRVLSPRSSTFQLVSSRWSVSALKSTRVYRCSR